MKSAIMALTVSLAQICFAGPKDDFEKAVVAQPNAFQKFEARIREGIEHKARNSSKLNGLRYEDLNFDHTAYENEDIAGNCQTYTRGVKDKVAFYGSNDAWACCVVIHLAPDLITDPAPTACLPLK